MIFLATLSCKFVWSAWKQKPSGTFFINNRVLLWESSSTLQICESNCKYFCSLKTENLYQPYVESDWKHFVSYQLKLTLKMSTRVYLGGLSHRARERDVEKFFRKFGRIRDISLKNGFAFVDFDDYR